MVVQIAKTILPDGAKFHIALRRIFGVGRSLGLECAEVVGISREMRTADLTPEHVRKCANYIQSNFLIGDELKRSIRDNILKLIQAKTYRGKRHELGLPVRGQRTVTNARTSRKFRRHIEYNVK